MTVIVRHLGLVDYTVCYQDMLDFSLSRQADSADEFWCLEHTPVYTLGLNGKREHLLNTPSIPVIKTDRGGQVTYHGPGQLVVYCLMDLDRKDYRVKELVRRLEQSIMDLLDDYGINNTRQTGAPGVYVDGKKIAALGIRVKRGYTWHGLALNVDMDLSPYDGINPCGYAGLQVTQLSHYGINKTVTEVADNLVNQLIKYLEPADAIYAGNLQHDHHIQTPG